MTLFVEYNEAGNPISGFEVALYPGEHMQAANKHLIVREWLHHTNQQINRMIDQVNADCVLDYWSKKDPTYVNHMAPMMCYMECEHHGPQIGSREYPFKGTSPEGLCPECGEDMMYAFQTKMLTTEQITNGPAERTQKILAEAREQRRGEDRGR